MAETDVKGLIERLRRVADRYENYPRMALAADMREAAEALAALSGTREAGEPVVQHPDDEAVDRFAASMKAKMRWEREERGRSGWDNPNECSPEYLVRLLIKHLGKGNPGNFEDVANFCMMLHQRGCHPRVLAEALAAPPAEVERGAETETLIDVMASLAAAISLLERSPKTAAPSDKMFDQMLDDYRASLERARAAALSGTREAGESVAKIVPAGCTGSSLAFSEGVLHVAQDGSGCIAIGEDDFTLEDDRCEGPDGPEGSVHWITRFPPGEMKALRDFLCGVTLAAPPAETAVPKGYVLVPRADAEFVTQIANRNEQSDAGDRLAVLLSAPPAEVERGAVTDETVRLACPQCDFGIGLHEPGCGAVTLRPTTSEGGKADG